MIQRARLGMGRVLGRREGKCIAQQASVEVVEFGSMMFCSGTHRVVHNKEQKCLTKFK